MIFRWNTCKWNFESLSNVQVQPCPAVSFGSVLGARLGGGPKGAVPAMLTWSLEIHMLKSSHSNTTLNNICWVDLQWVDVCPQNSWYETNGMKIMYGITRVGTKWEKSYKAVLSFFSKLWIVCVLLKHCNSGLFWSFALLPALWHWYTSESSYVYQTVTVDSEGWSGCLHENMYRLFTAPFVPFCPFILSSSSSACSKNIRPRLVAGSHVQRATLYLEPPSTVDKMNKKNPVDPELPNRYFQDSGKDASSEQGKLFHWVQNNLRMQPSTLSIDAILNERKDWKYEAVGVAVAVL